MNLTIDRLHLQLPPGFEHRADAIARRLSDELASLSWTRNLQVEQLSLPAQTVHPALNDRQIAQQLAHAVHAQITQGLG